MTGTTDGILIKTTNHMKSLIVTFTMMDDIKRKRTMAMVMRKRMRQPSRETRMFEDFD